MNVPGSAYPAKVSDHVSGCGSGPPLSSNRIIMEIRDYRVCDCDKCDWKSSPLNLPERKTDIIDEYIVHHMLVCPECGHVMAGGKVDARRDDIQV